MEAKDTVITNFALYWRNPEDCDDVGIAEDQAEITWDIAFKAGIQEVVEWTTRELGVDWTEEKEQLKKWGIK